MRTEANDLKRPGRVHAIIALVAGLLAACGGGDGPKIEARSQTITFGAVPVLPLGGTASMAATTSSGLALRYVSQTSSVCTVNWTTGLATALRPGDCTVAAIQDGDSTYSSARATLTVTVYIDPNQTITFAAAPALAQYDTATVTATASSGLPVTYSSQTPAICSVGAATGLVSGLDIGICTIAANQAGTASYPVYNPVQATQTFSVSPPAGSAVPGQPTGVTATLGATLNQVIVTVGATPANGTPITGYTVTSSPAGAAAAGGASPITVDCGGTCVGYAFTVRATNAVGEGPDSNPVNVVTPYFVLETFYEPATQPNDTIFVGSYDFDSTNLTIANLRGYLTQSMTGGCATITGCTGSYGGVPMTMVFTGHQLVSQAVTLGGVQGLLVTTFVLDTTNTFFTGWGGDGWTPRSAIEESAVIYFGWPTARNPYNGGIGNSYSMIFVNTADPAIPLTQPQIDWLAYADCSAGGMMSVVCMTGTSEAAYGAYGSMGGSPKSQTTVRQCADLNELDTLYSQRRLSADKASLCQSLDSSHP